MGARAEKRRAAPGSQSSHRVDRPPALATVIYCIDRGSRATVARTLREPLALTYPEIAVLLRAIRSTKAPRHGLLRRLAGRIDVRIILTSGLALLAAPAAVAAAPPLPARPRVTLEQLAVAVRPDENRAVVFTNKQSAYFYTQTHRNTHPEHARFRGLDVAGRHVFSDYHLTIDGVELDPATARATVFPDALVRDYSGGVRETLSLFDDRDLVEVTVAGASGDVRVVLSGDQVEPDGSEGGIDWYVSEREQLQQSADHVAVDRRGTRFLIAVAPSREAAATLAAQAAGAGPAWHAARRERLEALLNDDHYLSTDDGDLTASLRWITLTTDALIGTQRGAGIDAGLPWFDEYRGRDTFVALAGATLVTGRFAAARDILKSFAALQERDRTSAFYGRVPNIVKPESIDYHSTDATPRFIIALRDYVRYSGDRALIHELYPNIIASVEGSLANWTDASGYLLHRDDETWMDARRSSDLVPYSPRGTRAVDVQALWYEQLRAAAELAVTAGDVAAARRWSGAAEQLRAGFARDYLDPKRRRLADRLTADNDRDYTVRPNALFALALIDDEVTAARVLRQSWETLVFPWGVATLGPKDPLFHPYHLNPGRYPKDEAYHNGTVWPWLDGIAVQRMVEAGQPELAWRLFRSTSSLALERGVVGGLPETIDAYPHPGEERPRLTGAFLQAWSNAEHLRVWYQYILGIRPDLDSGEVLLAPRLPAALGSGDFSVRLGAGSLRAVFDRVAGRRRYVYRLAHQAARLTLDLPPYAVEAFKAKAGDSLIVEYRHEGVRARLQSASGKTKTELLLKPSADRQRRQRQLDAVFEKVQFAHPMPLTSHPVMMQPTGPVGRDSQDTAVAPAGALATAPR